MPNIEVAANTENSFGIVRSGNRLRDGGMATPARAFSYPVVALADEDIVGKSARSERQRVKKTVLHFGRIFAGKIVWGYDNRCSLRPGDVPISAKRRNTPA